MSSVSYYAIVFILGLCIAAGLAWVMFFPITGVFSAFMQILIGGVYIMLMIALVYNHFKEGI